MTCLRPFVPAQDFAHSLAFYEKIGFAVTYQDETLAILEFDRAGFLLQNYYVQEWAENCVLQFFVDDLDGWWANNTPDLAGKFGVREPSAPKMQPWGIRVGYVWDPAGVLWQVSQP